MKKKSELLLNIILMAVFAVAVVFLLVKAEDKLEVVSDLILYAGGFVLIRWGLNLMIPQSEDGDKKKLPHRNLFLFDAVLVIIGVILLVLVLFKVIDMSETIGMMYFCFSYLLILILAVGNTCIMVADAFKKKYIYTKKTLEVEGKKIDVDIFTVVNYKGNAVRVEIEAEINGEKVKAQGLDEAEATKNFIALYRTE
ncbi:MAG: hypothetical protein IJC69_08525 [Clostridia bacterium]|nr:hypothetical protein [Clostridia bacterium]